MSTRSVIAWKTPDGFKGVYHHWDGYPSGVGQHLASLVRAGGLLEDCKEPGDHMKGRIVETLEEVIDRHPGGWSTLMSLHAYKDSEATEPSVTHVTASSCGCEWAYVFDREKPWILEIWCSFCDPNGPHGGAKMIGAFGMGDPKGVWRKVAEVDCCQPDPDWEKMNDCAYTTPVEG